jgi:hypothetical protein
MLGTLREFAALFASGDDECACLKSVKRPAPAILTKLGSQSNEKYA